MSITAPPLLTEETLAEAVQYLAARDPALAEVVARFGMPPLWPRTPGFPTLIRIILEQQVSLASARAAYDRLLALASPLTPERFLAFDEATLKQVGFSRQKAAYGRGLAAQICAGRLDLKRLETLDDADARAELLQIKGIGPWSAEIYLLMALRRPDVWPSGDLALAAAVQRVKRLPTNPTREELEALGAAWRPWRAAAARLLWHHYLESRRNGKDSAKDHPKGGQEDG